MDEVRELAKDLWVIDHPFSMPGGVELGTRTTLVRLVDGGLWMHSPGPLTPQHVHWLQENGPVRAIVAPNLLHHIFLADAAAAFPDAQVYGPEGLEAKLSGKLDFRPLLGAENPWSPALEMSLLPGCPRMNEWVFLHRATRTLIVTDLVFNVMRSSSFVTRLFMRANGAWQKFGPTRLARSLFFQNTDQVKLGLEAILKWDFDRVVMTHGDVLESGGIEKLRAGYGWLLG
jgi:hypothetical protein